jgi:hypothetical protein
MVNKTKKDYFNELRAIAIDNADLVAFIDHELELLANKKNVVRKPTATQVENDGFKAQILTFLAEADAPLPIKAIQAGVPALAELSNQRVARLLTDLRKEGKVARTYVKKVAHFALGAEEAEEA